MIHHAAHLLLRLLLLLLAQKLLHAAKNAYLKTRLKQAGDNLRLKTGTLKDVRALAGYWLGEQPKVVVVVINSPNSDAYVKDMDRLVSEIVLPGGKSWVALGTTCEARQDV